MAMSFYYSGGNTLLYRYDPRLKLLMLLGAAMAVHQAALAELVCLALGTSISLALFLYPRSSSLRQIFYALRFVLVLLAFSLALGGIPSVSMLLGFSLRLYTWVLLGFLYLGTSSITQLRGTFYSLTSWIPGFPASYFALMISISLSFLPRFTTALKTGREALDSRGGVPWYRPLRLIKALSVPLLLRTVKQSAQLSDALYARGFHEKRVFSLGRLSLLQTVMTVLFLILYPVLRFFIVYLVGYLGVYSFLG